MIRAMSDPNPVAGFILAGGASSRMGVNKARMEISGTSLLHRTARLLQPLVTDMAVIGPPDCYSQMGLRLVPDDRPGLGPLGGIATALRVSSSPWNLIVGCDLPYLTGEWLHFLLRRALASSADALLPETARGPEPLCAMYHRRCLASILAAIERNNLKITQGLSACVVEIIPEAEWKAFDSGGRLFKNMNAPADYEEARAFFEGEGTR